MKHLLVPVLIILGMVPIPGFASQPQPPESNLVAVSGSLQELSHQTGVPIQTLQSLPHDLERTLARGASQLEIAPGEKVIQKIPLNDYLYAEIVTEMKESQRNHISSREITSRIAVSSLVGAKIAFVSSHATLLFGGNTSRLTNVYGTYGGLGINVNTSSSSSTQGNRSFARNTFRMSNTYSSMTLYSTKFIHKMNCFSTGRCVNWWDS